MSPLLALTSINHSFGQILNFINIKNHFPCLALKSYGYFIISVKFHNFMLALFESFFLWPILSSIISPRYTLEAFNSYVILCENTHKKEFEIILNWAINYESVSFVLFRLLAYTSGMSLLRGCHENPKKIS